MNPIYREKEEAAAKGANNNHERTRRRPQQKPDSYSSQTHSKNTLTRKTQYGSSTPSSTASTWKNSVFKHSAPNELGRPSYDPSDLLKLYVYGYLNQVRSSRKLERECHRNVEVMWLMKKLAPDFKTIADFRKDNVDCVKGVFKEFVKFCMSLDLYGSKLVAIDGVKFKAVNSLDKNFNQKTLTYRLKIIDEHVSKYIKRNGRGRPTKKRRQVQACRLA